MTVLALPQTHALCGQLFDKPAIVNRD